MILQPQRDAIRSTADEQHCRESVSEKTAFMSQFVLPERWERILEVSQKRTKYLTVVLEDIHYAQNSSAVVRSCDCFGIQDLHYIYNNPPEGQKRIRKHVAQGAEKWVDIHRHLIKDNIGTEKTTEKVLSRLKRRGYRIVATLPDQNAVGLGEFDLRGGKTALVMGNEQRGVTETVRSIADEFLTIPMHGFSESFNLSVSTAIILNSLVTRMQNSRIPWRLPPEEIDSLRLEWLMKTIPKAKDILAAYEQSV